MAESTFPEDCGPSLNSLCSLAAAVTAEGPPDEGKRIRIEESIQSCGVITLVVFA
jgi:hypothetical protein